MQTATVNVKYVNAPKPGKKKGSIKTVDDQMFGVWADKISQFQTGQTYEIEYTSEDYNGQTYRTVKSVKPAGGTVAAAPKANGNGSYRETSAKDAERMFVCSIVNAFIQAGKVDMTDLVDTVNGARRAWHATFGQAQRNPDMGDDHVAF